MDCIAVHKCNPLKYLIINFYKHGAVASRNLSRNKNWRRWMAYEAVQFKKSTLIYQCHLTLV